MTVPHVGSQQTFGINTGASTTSLFGFCTVGKHFTHLERQGTRGTFSHDKDDVVDGPYTVSGQIIMQPTNAELTLLETYIIGTSGSVDDTQIGDFKIEIDRGNDVYGYSNCTVDRAVYSGTQGGLLNLTLDIVGRAESTPTISAPSEPASAAPFSFDNIALHLLGSAREVQEFEMTIDNQLIKDRFQMDATVTDLPQTDRLVTLRTTHSWSSNTATLYSTAMNTTAAKDTFTLSGAGNRVYTFGILKVNQESPPLSDRGPMILTLDMTAYKDGSTKEIAQT